MDRSSEPASGCHPAEAAARFFEGHDDGLAVWRAIEAATADLEDLEVVASRSQLALRTAGVGFAWVWRPGQYVRSAVPAVLSFSLPERVASPRFKEVLEPRSGHWMHHLELTSPDCVDKEVAGWLRRAHAAAVERAGRRRTR